MKKSNVTVMIMAISIAVIGIFTANAAPPLISYQAKLCDSSGNPVPDGNYQMIFSIYGDSVGGTPLWTEVRPAVSTSSGYFHLNLGSTEPWDERNMLGPSTRYLQIQIGSMPPMSPRTKLTSVPQSVFTQRVSGDIETSDSSLTLQRGTQAVRLLNGPETIGLVIEDRPTDLVNGRVFRAGMDSTGVNFGLDGPNGSKMIEATAQSGVAGRASWVMFNPQPEPPGHDPFRLFEVSTNGLGQASWVMFNPQPEPPGSDPFRLFEVSTGVGGEASMVMFNPQPEPPGSDPFLTLRTNVSGANFSMNAPQARGAALVNNHPQINIRCDSTASRLLLQRGRTMVGGPSDSTGFSMYADSVSSEMRFFNNSNLQLKITSNATGATLGFIDDGSEYMGVEPAPWHAGGELTMSDAAGGPTLVLSSDGMASIGTGNHTNILTIAQYSSTDPIADAWTTYSSRRWKTNIEPLKNPLSKVMSLRGVSFDWKENGKHDIGFIAEEVGEIVPEVVAYEKNGIDAQSVDYARLTSLLVEAVKEQQKMIDDLKAELVDLKAEINKKADLGK